MLKQIYDSAKIANKYGRISTKAYKPDLIRQKPAAGKQPKYRSQQGTSYS